MEMLLENLLQYSGMAPYLIVLGLLLACGFGLPMPEDIVLFSAGMMAYYQAADVYIMLLVCFSGVMAGDSCVFLIGSRYGHRVTRLPFVQRVLPPERLKRVAEKLHRQGPKVIFAARFLPGLRTPIFFSAGTLHLPFRTFFLYDGAAALISVPTIVYATFFFGSHVDRVIQIVKKLQFGVVATIALIVGILLLKYWLTKRREKAFSR
jgi:membrane protein DedA with SNARE-associated domain